MKRPWMPLYVADYLADTQHLNAAQSGAYLHLIMHYWIKGRLPEDEAIIQRISRLSSRQWSQSCDLLRSLFCDHWRHPRIDRELAQAIEISHKRSASAKQMHCNRAAKAHANGHDLHTHARVSVSVLNQEGKEDTEERSSG
jgi:uncharacterized protein YdaU (DUF1376 family)